MHINKALIKILAKNVLINRHVFVKVFKSPADFENRFPAPRVCLLLTRSVLFVLLKVNSVSPRFDASRPESKPSQPGV